MKKLAVIILIGVLAISCEKSEDIPLKNENIISLSEAEVLFQEYLDWIYYNLGEIPFTLTDVTTPELYSKFEARFYKVSSGHSLVDKNLVYITKEKIVHLVFSPNHNGDVRSEFKELIVADLNSDNKYEIYFIATSESSSGNAELVGVYCLVDILSKESTIYSGVFYYLPVANAEYKLEKADDQNLYIRYKDEDFDLRVSKYIREKNNNYFIDCYRKQLPDEVNKRILPFYQFGI